ncbi:hypothetical protein GECvBMG_gp277 [Salmonella phage GEC_vB_MG]|uniref:Uncharacterized protein 241 n=1 Tax=Salmonella phage PVPSE1 TaxID=889338 RepID=G3BMA7_9CAUD|nr:hypothetical protein PVP-SE1_gp241 [Salmonella phage PVPSE1]ADP02637.1 hypothetical protein [Salmonella phage PVPSE1]QPI14821.1 hypothetical protein GECvBMG_gp277 [Salmonella phage GEC_vB_MG]
MEKPKPKFEVGQKVKDLLSGRILSITSRCYFSGWVYSFDSVGMYLYPEEDLEAVNGTA